MCSRQLHQQQATRQDDEAVNFVNAITPVAEEEAHHPDLEVRWGHVGVKLRTHAIDGLSENDFVLAAKIDQLPRL